MKGPQLKMPKVTSRALGGLLAVSLAVGAAIRMPASADDTGFFGSVTIQRHALDAANSWHKRDYIHAMHTYRKCIGLDQKEPLFYFGLYAAASRAGVWDQAAFAIEQLFDLDPSYKGKMNAELGETLYRLNRYDEAIPLLKSALLTVDQESLVTAKMKSLMTKSIPPDMPPDTSGVIAVMPVQPIVPIGPPPKRVEEANQESVRPDTSDTALNFQNAFRSESITLCEYVGYDKSDGITFYNPPRATFHITKILKGPPLNASLPVRYEFHNKTKSMEQTGALHKKLETGGVMPDGWKFGDDKMPKKGSKWIIFIPNAVPRAGMFDTYQGSYGRQEATDENLNTIYRIIEEHSGQQ